MAKEYAKVVSKLVDRKGVDATSKKIVNYIDGKKATGSKANKIVKHMVD